jgi:hypothetical protein
MINRKEFLKRAALAVGAIIALPLAFSTAPDEEPDENWFAGEVEKLQPYQAVVKEHGKYKVQGWHQLGLPAVWRDKPQERHVKRILKAHLKKTPGYCKFTQFEFILHPPEYYDDPLRQRWEGGMTCYALPIREAA